MTAQAESSETTTNVYDYYAFGKELGSWTQNIQNRYTYTAREWDGESEQYYYRARYYDGGGRFLSRDANEAFRYFYVDNTPVKATDPSGETAAIGVHGTTIHVILNIGIYADPNSAANPLLVSQWPTMAAKIKAGVENSWNGHTVGKCDVKFRANVWAASLGSTEATADNVIEIFGGAGRSRVWPPNRGRWSFVDSAESIGHESGHLMGLEDDYVSRGNSDVDVAGHEGHLMGINTTTGNKADYHEVFDILDHYGIIRWLPVTSGTRVTPMGLAACGCVEKPKTRGQ